MPAGGGTRGNLCACTQQKMPPLALTCTTCARCSTHTQMACVFSVECHGLARQLLDGPRVAWLSDCVHSHSHSTPFAGHKACQAQTAWAPPRSLSSTRPAWLQDCTPRPPPPPAPSSTPPPPAAPPALAGQPPRPAGLLPATCSPDTAFSAMTCIAKQACTRQWPAALQSNQLPLCLVVRLSAAAADGGTLCDVEASGRLGGRPPPDAAAVRRFVDCSLPPTRRLPPSQAGTTRSCGWCSTARILTHCSTYLSLPMQHACRCATGWNY